MVYFVRLNHDQDDPSFSAYHTSKQVKAAINNFVILKGDKQF